MLSRSFRNIKVKIDSNLFNNYEFLEIFLKRIDYQNDISQLKEVLLRSPSCVQACSLLFDIGETINPRFGIEFYALDTSYKEKKKSTRIFLDFLESENLTNRAKNNAILSWIGGSREESYSLYGENPFSYSYHDFIRGVNHIKLVYQPGLPLEAKAYLSVLSHSHPISRNLTNCEQSFPDPVATNEGSILHL